MATILNIANENQICPFEFQLDLSLFCDFIICDYNYLFDPISYLQRYFEDSNTKKLVRDFIYDKTHELIDYTPNYNGNTLLSLVNTLYFNDGFSGELQETKNNYNFTNVDGSIKEIKLLNGRYNNGSIYQNELYSQFYVKTSHNQKITFVLPNDEHGVDEILKGEILDNVIAREYENLDTNKSAVLFPSFEANYNESLKESLTSLGLGEIFNNAELKNLTDMPVAGVDIFHVANIKVNKKGVTAAAATIINSNMTGIHQDTYETSELIIDRPFVFVVQTEENLPLFVGAIRKI